MASDNKNQPSPDVIITGLPRSGTTLATALAHNPPHAIALHEPENKERHSADARAVAAFIANEFADIRKRIRAGEAITVRESLDETPLTNYLSRSSGSRRKNYQCILKSFDNLPAQYALSMKHPALFSAILPELIKLNRFTIIALIRNPIDTIMSWRTVPFPISKGRLPGGERYWPELAAIAASDIEILKKQVQIWELFASRFVAAGKAVSTIKYEALCESPKIVPDLLGISAHEIKISPSARIARDVPENLRDLLQSFAPTATKLYPAEFS